MLTHLSIQNFTLVERLEIEFSGGLTAITGETGAGKSILLDALGYTLGDRVEAGRVRQGAKQAEVTAEFDISEIPEATGWLEEQAMDSEESCIIRRVISAEGRSRAWINGQSVTLGQLKELAELLINIHGQNEHQRLLRKDFHRDLLDEFAGITDTTKSVSISWGDWKSSFDSLKDFQENSAENEARAELLAYQVKELNELSLQVGEFESLEQEQKLLSNAESILKSLAELKIILSDSEEFNVESMLQRATTIASSLPNDQGHLADALKLIESALIQTQEAANSIERGSETVRHDPERLQEVESRLGTAFDLARKHHVTPDQLPETQEKLSAELELLGGGENRLEALTQEEASKRAAFEQTASELTKARAAAAKKLEQSVNSRFDQLGMKGAELKVEFTQLEIARARGGVESAELLIRTNLGQPQKPLAKIASGGELSRVSLAIQVEAANSSQTPSLVFDEVDVGIGGQTAAIVGQLLSELGAKTQVICVTHLPQVASASNNHLCVEKSSSDESTRTQISQLSEEERIEEIARMLGGIEITEQTRLHAKEMLTQI